MVVLVGGLRVCVCVCTSSRARLDALLAVNKCLMNKVVSECLADR